MIKAVIFDCFGVLTTEAFDLFRDKYLGDDQAKREVANKAMDELNMGQINYDNFCQQLANVSGVDVGKIEEILSESQPNEPLFEYIRTKLKPKYKIGMLSNAGDDWLAEMFSEQDIKLFDGIQLSFRTGYIKPQAEAYERAAKELGVNPEECLFIDDRQKYIDGAKSVGMPGLLYKDFRQLKLDLSKILAAGSNN